MDKYDTFFDDIKSILNVEKTQSFNVIIDKLSEIKLNYDQICLIFGDNSTTESVLKIYNNFLKDNMELEEQINYILNYLNVDSFEEIKEKITHIKNYEQILDLLNININSSLESIIEKLRKRKK